MLNSYSEQAEYTRTVIQELRRVADEYQRQRNDALAKVRDLETKLAIAEGRVVSTKRICEYEDCDDYAADGNALCIPHQNWNARIERGEL